MFHIDNFYFVNVEEENNNSLKNDVKEKEENSNLIQNEKLKSENILNKIENLGYDRNYVKDCLKNNKICHATVIYYLMMNYDRFWKRNFVFYFN